MQGPWTAFRAFSVSSISSPPTARMIPPVLERAIQYGTKYQMEQLSPQISLFGGGDGQSQELQEPPIPMGTMRDGEVLGSLDSARRAEF